MSLSRRKAIRRHLATAERLVGQNILELYEPLRGSITCSAGQTLLASHTGFGGSRCRPEAGTQSECNVGLRIVLTASPRRHVAHVRLGVCSERATMLRTSVLERAASANKCVTRCMRCRSGSTFALLACLSHATSTFDGAHMSTWRESVPTCTAAYDQLQNQHMITSCTHLSHSSHHPRKPNCVHGLPLSEIGPVRCCKHQGRC